MFNKEINTLDLFYDKLSAKNKQAIRKKIWTNDLINTLSYMFEYDLSDEYRNIDPRVIELILITNGVCGFYYDSKIKGVVCGTAYLGGELDCNGIGTKINGNTLNGKGYQGVNNVDCAIGYNTNLLQPDLNIYRFAEQFAEVDLSQACNITYTRIAPTFKVKNNKIKNMLDHILDNQNVGKVSSVVDNNIMDDEPINQIPVNDINAIDKLQYLSTYHNDLLRRFYTFYGQALSEGMKQAQQSVAEVSSNTSSSFIIPLEKLRQREEMCKRVMNVFGGKITVRFSEPWAIEFNKWSTKKDTEGVDDMKAGENIDDNI